MLFKFSPLTHTHTQTKNHKSTHIIHREIKEKERRKERKKGKNNKMNKDHLPFQRDHGVPPGLRKPGSSGWLSLGGQVHRHSKIQLSSSTSLQHHRLRVCLSVFQSQINLHAFPLVDTRHLVCISEVSFELKRFQVSDVGRTLPCIFHALRGGWMKYHAWTVSSSLHRTICIRQQIPSFQWALGCEVSLSNVTRVFQGISPPTHTGRSPSSWL